MNRIKNLNDVLSGAVLIIVALLGFYLSWRLNSGHSAAMGPGYVPKMLGFILIGLGVATVVYGFLREGDPFEEWYPRPLFWILASVAFFGFTIERLGLVVAVGGLVVLGCLAHKGTKAYESIILAVGMAGFAVIVFVKALGLPILLWPPMLVGF